MEDKILKIFELLPKVNDTLIRKFFDLESEKLLDEKIEVLTLLIEGKVPADIPKYYDVLELMPKEGEMWD